MEWLWIIIGGIALWAAYGLGKRSRQLNEIDDIPEDELGTIAVIAAAVEDGAMTPEAAEREIVAWTKFNPDVSFHWKRLGPEGRARLAADMRRLRADPAWQKREAEIVRDLENSFAEDKAAEIVAELKRAGEQQNPDKKA